MGSDRLTDAQLDATEEWFREQMVATAGEDLSVLNQRGLALVAEVREARATRAKVWADVEAIALSDALNKTVAERDAARAEIDRLRGLIQSELINDAHYCETCETAYQSPEGMPPRCPRCELDAAEKDVQEARSALREARAALAKAEAERDAADGELSKHIASANRYGSVTENTRRLASALGMREGKHTADSIAEAALDELTARRAEVERLGVQVNDLRAEHAAGPLDALQIVQKDRDEWKRRAEAAVEEIKLLRAALSGRTVSCERCNETSREVEKLRTALAGCATAIGIEHPAEHGDALGELVRAYFVAASEQQESMLDELKKLRAVADAAEHVVPMPPHLAEALRKAGR